MNKRAEAMGKARQWKEGITGGYETTVDKRGVTLRRWVDRNNPNLVTRTVPNPTGNKGITGGYKTYTDPRGNQLREWVNYSNSTTPNSQVSKVKPSPQSQEDFNYGRPPAGLSNEAWTIYNLGKSEREKLRQDSDAQWRRADEAAQKSQAATNANILKLQQGINETSRLNTKTTTEGGIKGQVISTEAIKYRADQDRLSSFEQTRGGIEQSKVQAGASNFAATTSADANKAVANTQAGASNYQSDNQRKGIEYQSDRTLEGLNKQTDANYFLEREKNANQKEKNRQDLWLNAGLGILDSINKQRASSSQAAAQIYSSYLSSNPYNFKYWD